MLNKIKLIIAAFFIVCLFLPLSSCQYQVPDTQTREMQDKVEYYYVLPNEKVDAGGWRYVPVLIFILPLLISLLALFNNRGQLLMDVTGFLLGAAIVVYIAIHSYMTALLAGGYLAAIAALLYMLLNIITLVQGIMKLRQAHANHSA